ncbi:alpha/beta hydrolase [Pedobacter panaciterrae]|uniref:alpha/beta fold hydrolase n=1 Tax=Pedobacter panaciterrae TaxID=363849 RepID=UPI00155D9BF7|nr:alpha/beta hydrolase [Pedobacter panaciterrae]NQX54043.1 alpha/beta hydrolase [Pedobacter panaciterrae]
MAISLEAALSAPNQFVTTQSGKIAYRVLGEGKPLVLCNRFRGTLDTWDPKFISHLAKEYQVILFDYHGIGLSEGTHQTTAEALSKDLKLFIESLKVGQVILGGWSYGGLVAQSFAVIYPEMITHLLVIGSNPPGNNPVPPEQIFFDTALKPVNDFQDELILFFEPASPVSVALAEASHQRIALRTSDLDVSVKPEQFNNYFLGGASFKEDLLNTRQNLYQSNLPVLVVMGDHDPSFPVENWFPMVKNSENMQLVILSRTGHGPQHQYPRLVAGYIRKFIDNAK